MNSEALYHPDMTPQTESGDMVGGKDTDQREQRPRRAGLHV